MIGVFRTKKPLNIPILFVYGLLLKFPYVVIHPEVLRSSSDGFLFSYLAEFISDQLSAWPLIIGFIIYLLLFLQALLINAVVNNFKLIPGTGMVVAMSYLLVSSFFPEWNTFSSPLIVNVFNVYIFWKLISLVKVQNAKPIFFNIGFVVGICSFFYFPSLALIILGVLGLLVARPPQPSEWVILFLGLILPWYLLFSWLFLIDGLHGFSMSLFDLSLPDFKIGIRHYILIGLVAIMYLWGITIEQYGHLKKMIQIRRGWMLTLLSSIALIGLPLLDNNDNMANWLLSLIFITPFIGYAFFSTAYRKLGLLMHWVMVGFIIYFQYFGQ